MADANTTSTLDPPSSGGYLLNEAAHRQLCSAKETLFLLYMLSLSGRDDPIVSPERWTGCLHLLTSQLEQVIQSTDWHQAI
jgi:hypothetical protein